MSITRTPAWSQLATLAEASQDLHLRELFAADPQRFTRFSLRHDGMLLDFSKQRITAEIWQTLHRLWHESGVREWLDGLHAGAAVNHTEGRAALHHALRHPGTDAIRYQERDVMPDVRAVLARMEHICHAIHSGAWHGASGRPIRQVVNIGIGGSDLGARMAARALAAHHVRGCSVHFVANLDGSDLAGVLAPLDPAETLFIVASKTFGTQETMRNAASARAWITAALGEAAVARHFVAVSTNLEAVARFGIDPANALEFWDWVGGRFSLWSAVGLPLALAIGFANFRELLKGGAAMDRHFIDAPVEHNLPATLALLDLWNTNFLGAATRVVLPYSQSLAILPRYLQQLEMESNGKQVSRDGTPVGIDTAPVTWGEAGTSGQHAFYQMIHQGGRLAPCEFIALIEPDFPLPEHHEMLLANCFAQSEALMIGKTLAEAGADLAQKGLAADEVARLAPFRVFPGNQPSTTLLLPRLDPATLGRLIALYEHKTVSLGGLWRINPFDQWGVEYGKQLADRLLPVINGDTPAVGLNASTAGLIAACRP